MFCNLPQLTKNCFAYFFRSESELKQTIVKEISNTLNRHAIYIREEDRSHEDKDEEAIQVPKVGLMKKKMSKLQSISPPSFYLFIYFYFLFVFSIDLHSPSDGRWRFFLFYFKSTFLKDKMTKIPIYLLSLTNSKKVIIN